MPMTGISATPLDASAVLSGAFVAWAPPPNGSDDTAALTAAISLLPSDGGVLMLRAAGESAPYKLPNGLSIGKRISVVGQGGGSHEAGITIIECSSATANALNFTLSGVRLRGFQLKNTASSPSAGAGVKISASRAHLSDLTVVGFYVNVDIDGGEWTMTDCYISTAVKYGLKISRPAAPDSGDMAVQSCYFLGSGTFAADAAIRYESAGGLRLVNSKFNWDGSPGGRFVTALDMSLTATTTDLLVSNCSFENTSSHLINLRQSGSATATFGNITISGCQFAAYSDDSTVNAIRIAPANGTTPFKTIAITGNTFLGSNRVGTAVYLSNVVDVTVAGGVCRDFATFLETASCSNVTDLTDPSGTYAGIATAPQMPTRQRAPQISMIASWQSGHGWTSGGTGTVTLNDTSDSAVGSQCVSITTSGTGAYAYAQKLGLTAVDTTTSDLQLWVKVTNLQYLQTLLMLATSDSFSNIRQGSIYNGNAPQVGAPTGPIREGEWVPLRFNLGQFANSGSPTLSAITGFRIQAQDYGNAGQTATVYLGGFGAYPRSTQFPNGVVTFGFDDTYAAHRTIAAPYLAKYGWAGTAYIIADLVASTSAQMTLAQMKDLKYVYGWEIAPHAYTVVNHNAGLDTLTTAQLQTEITSLMHWLQSNGLAGSTMFAYPRGRHSMSTDGVISQYFSSARTIFGLTYDEVLQPGIPLRRRSVQMVTGSTSTMTNAIDRAYSYGNWCELLFHNIVASSADSSNSCLTSEFQTIVDYCHTKGIPVLPAGDVWRIAGL